MLIKRFLTLVISSVFVLFATTKIAFAASCVVSVVSGINLVYDPSDNVDQKNVGRVGVLCTRLSLTAEDVAYTVQMSRGNGTFDERLLRSVGSDIRYNLYKEASHTSIWGDNTSGYTGLSDAYRLSVLTALKEYNVYLSAPAKQPVTAGTYTDTIMLTVEY